MTTFVIDARHWLDEHGNIPLGPPRLRRNMLRVARIIEYGGPLEPGTMLDTLIECSRKPKLQACPGLLWVEKRDDHHWSRTARSAGRTPTS